MALRRVVPYSTSSVISIIVLRKPGLEDLRRRPEAAAMMSAISGRVVFCIGHIRDDLTDRPLKFWSVYSYLVV
jgi:hypothetical protein